VRKVKNLRLGDEAEVKDVDAGINELRGDLGAPLLA
jgi:putative component of toxin-antitoxin plasmid stabilization module